MKSRETSERADGGNLGRARHGKRNGVALGFFSAGSRASGNGVQHRAQVFEKPRRRGRSGAGGFSSVAPTTEPVGEPGACSGVASESRVPPADRLRPEQKIRVGSEPGGS